MTFSQNLFGIPADAGPGYVLTLGHAVPENGHEVGGTARKRKLLLRVVVPSFRTRHCRVSPARRGARRIRRSAR